MIVHCLFEQSGTFKNAFKKDGIEAYDYDIQNEFGETDYVTDLFKEIDRGYQGEPSLFDKINPDDLIFAFFPCVRFENQIMLWFRGQNYAQRKWDLEKKMTYCMKLQNELAENYNLVNKLFILCIRKNLKLVMENPYSEEHFLRRYWCFQAKVIDKDRRLNGDYFKKPTQYWFLNCEPKNNLIFEVADDNSIKHKSTDCVSWCSGGVMKREVGIDCSQKTARSMIHPQYADRFIREHILDEEIWRDKQ